MRQGGVGGAWRGSPPGRGGTARGGSKEEAAAREEETSRVQGAAPQPSPPPYIGVRGLWGAPQTHLGPAKGGNLPPKAPKLGLGLPPPLPLPHGPWRAGAASPCGLHHAPLVHVSPPRFVAPKVGPSGTFPEPSRTFRYPTGIFRNFSDTSGNHFPYMNLILRTLPDLLVMSRIPSETPNHHSFIPSIISSQTLAKSER